MEVTLSQFDRNAPGDRGLIEVEAYSWWKDVRTEIMALPGQPDQKRQALDALGPAPPEGTRITLDREGNTIDVPGIEVDPELAVNEPHPEFEDLVREAEHGRASTPLERDDDNDLGL